MQFRTNAQDVKRASTIRKQELLDLAEGESLRLRAFGETAIFGQHEPFNGDYAGAARALSRLIDDGHVGVYRDEDGLFVGPSNPALIDAREASHGIQ